MTHNGKKISGGAARNVRIKKAGGLESIIEYATKTGALLAAQQIMGNQIDPPLKLNSLSGGNNIFFNYRTTDDMAICWE